MDVKLEKLVEDVYLQTLEKGGYVYLSASGSSMYPFIKNKDILTIEVPHCKNLVNYKKQKEILKLLFNHHISSIPLKGIFLARQLHGDISARDLSVNFDLLIEEKNKEKTRSLLEENGYSYSDCNEIKQ